MKRERVFQIAFLVFVSVLSIAFFIETFSIRQSKSQADYLIKATFLPRLIIILIVVFGGIASFSELRKPIQEKEKDNLLHILYSICVMLISVLLLDLLGFIFVGTAFLFFQILIISGETRPTRKGILKLLAISFGCSLVFALGFRYGFNIGIPLFPFR
ncbi:MAG: tripartite tricarboxylate transporter TctB family protein [Sphaerochaetaceae bacterium]